MRKFGSSRSEVSVKKAFLEIWLLLKIDKLLSSERIFDIKALVQEQPNLILKLTETVISQKERIDRLEESLI